MKTFKQISSEAKQGHAQLWVVKLLQEDLKNNY